MKNRFYVVGCATFVGFTFFAATAVCEIWLIDFCVSPIEPRPCATYVECTQPIPEIELPYEFQPEDQEFPRYGRYTALINIQYECLAEETLECVKNLTLCFRMQLFEFYDCQGDLIGTWSVRKLIATGGGDECPMT